MKIDFSRVLKSLSGESMIHREMIQPKRKSAKDMEAPVAVDRDLTLRDVSLNALLTVVQNENLPGVEKLKRYHLAEQIYKSKAPIDLSVEQLGQLKELISKVYVSPLVCGQAWEMLDPSSKDSE